MRRLANPLHKVKPLLTMRLVDKNALKFGRKFVFGVKISILVT
jgi:hypothetical protein